MIKTLILAASAAAAVTIGCMVTNSSSEQNINLNEAQTQNLEALADIELETGGNFKIIFESEDIMTCEDGGSFKCPVLGFLQ